MGNRTFLYTSNTLPAAIDGPPPDICHAVASGNNTVPTLWRVLFSDAVAGPAQDAQQIFLPSVSAGIYAERGLAEQRLFTLLDFVAQHPLLPDPAGFRRKTADLRQFLATQSGQAYSADLNEYLLMAAEEDFDEDDYDFGSDNPADFSDDTPLDTFMQQCARTWQKTERAMALKDYDSIVNLHEIDLRNALHSLGFECWNRAGDDIEDDDAPCPAGGGHTPVQGAGGHGVIDHNGACVIPAVYAAVTWRATLAAWECSADNGEKAVFFADGRPWFAGAYDHIDALTVEGDALVGKKHLYGSIRRDGSPGLPIAYGNITPLHSEIMMAGVATPMYAVTGPDRKRLTGVCFPDGTLRSPLQFSTIEAMPLVPEQPEASEASEEWTAFQPRLFLIRRKHHGLGVWSADEKMDVLACKYDTIHSFRFQERVGLLAHEEDSGYTLVDAQGRPHTAQPYDWLCKESYEAAQAWHFFPLGQDIASAWSQYAPIYGWRDGQGWRIYPDGREESELDYQLRRAVDGSDADACKVLGDIYFKGQGVDIDNTKACAYYATATAGGNKDAQYQYGYCLMEGLGCEQDAAAARRQFEALVPENKMALTCLGYLYECRLGDDIDPVRARALYVEAAVGGEWGLALAQKNAGNCYLYGIGGDVDEKTALAYYELAAKESDFPERNGNSYACQNAAGLHTTLAKLADSRKDPEGVEYGLQRAIHYYKEMLLYGREEAHIELARCYLGEFGGERKLDAARYHLRAALDVDEHEDEAQELWDQHQLG